MITAKKVQKDDPRVTDSALNVSRKCPERFKGPNSTADPYSWDMFKIRILGIFKLLDQEFNMAGCERVAKRLSLIVGKNPPWTKKYIQGLVKGTLMPSRMIIKSMALLEAHFDGMSIKLAGAKSVRGLVPDGIEFPAGTYISVAPKYCKECRLSFVPNSVLRKYCDICRPSRKRSRRLEGTRK